MECKWSTKRIQMEYQLTTNGVPMECQYNATSDQIDYQLRANEMPMEGLIDTNGTPIDYQWSSNGMPMAVENVPVAKEWGSGNLLVKWQSIVFKFISRDG